jgi:hypothetical protein
LSKNSLVNAKSTIVSIFDVARSVGFTKDVKHINNNGHAGGSRGGGRFSEKRSASFGKKIFSGDFSGTDENDFMSNSTIMPAQRSKVNSCTLLKPKLIHNRPLTDYRNKGDFNIE